jgi:hypothetical protein
LLAELAAPASNGCAARQERAVFLEVTMGYADLIRHMQALPGTKQAEVFRIGASP